uniref:Uncharacterized protein n=1 Tax=Solanum tuberosum TaxID=4113 RepID=M1E0R1_SOLTU
MESSLFRGHLSTFVKLELAFEEYGLRNKARTLTSKKKQVSLRIAKSIRCVAEWPIRPPKVPVCQALKERTKLAMEMSSQRFVE